MSERWTPAQRAAIDSRGGGVIVSAAAGSGKTSVLVERIISIITDEQKPVDADRLLVVTFTNAAASEMSSRIKESLAKLVAASPRDRRLRRQALLIKRAQISTVHSFCMSILREHFNELDISCDFTLADDTVCANLCANAMALTLDTLFANEASGIERLCDLFGRSRTADDTQVLIEKLYDFECNLARPERWESGCIDALASSELSSSPFADFLYTYADDALTHAKAALVRALDICADDETLAANYTPALEQDLNVVNALLAPTRQRDWEQCRELLTQYVPARLGTRTRDADPTLKESAKRLRDEAKKILRDVLPERVFSCTADEYKRDCELLLSPMRTLFSAVRLFEQNLYEQKLARKTFDFSDLERLTLRLLLDQNGGKTPAAQKLTERFAYVLVDEYQDTNEIQDLIFKTVSDDERNLFCVGDMKQSIYSFRRADPSIFLARRDRANPLKTGLFPQRIPLSNNFRSCREVIDAVNGVFSPIMTRACGGTDYSDDEQLACHAQTLSTGESGMMIDVVSGTAADEARHIASMISNMLASDGIVYTKTGERRCRPGDFCILLRSMKNRAEVYADALERAGIAVWCEGSAGLFDASEVRILLSLLRVADNPRRDIDLAAVLLSPLFSLTSRDLALLRAEDANAPLISLVRSSREEKCVRFCEALALIRGWKGSMSTAQLLRQCVDFLDAETLLCAGSELSRRQSNIRAFIQFAEERSQREGGLPELLRLCDYALKNGFSFGGSFTPPENSVCITTAHKSKGLEWPVIIVANANKQFNKQDSHDPTMLFDAALGAGARVKLPCADAFYAHTSLAYCALSLASQLRTVSEEMRVLYVALTRARQRIIVTACSEKPLELLEKARLCADGEADSFTVRGASSWLDWLLLSFFYAQSERANEEDAVVYKSDSCVLRVCETPDDDGGEAESQQLPKPDESLCAELVRRFDYTSPFAALSQIPSKLSVTALAEDHSAERVYVPSFARKTLSAAERGTAIHRFLQCADYSAARADIRQELERLVSGQYLTREQADSIELKKLSGFFNSELSERVSRGKCLRELEFMDVIKASELFADSCSDSDAEIVVQGIADCVLVEPDGAVLIDYKSDRVKDVSVLLERYSAQLRFYRAALAKRLNMPIKRSVIFSLELGVGVDVK